MRGYFKHQKQGLNNSNKANVNRKSEKSCIYIKINLKLNLEIFEKTCIGHFF